MEYELTLKKVDRVIEFNQEERLKPYIDMNTELKEIGQKGTKKDFLQLINNHIVEKTVENVRNIKNIKLVTTD